MPYRGVKKHLTDDEKDYIASLLIVGITHIYVSLAAERRGREKLCEVIIFIISLAYYIFNGQYFHTLIVHTMVL